MVSEGQEQERRPGIQSSMQPQPESEKPEYKGSGRLNNKVAIVTGGDSGIGRAIAIHFAKEGADIVIVYLNEHKDAKETEAEVLKEGKKALLIDLDIGDENNCAKVINKTLETFGRLDILINNSAEQHPQESIEDISKEQLERTFRTNIFSMFFLVKAALPHLKKGSSIINTTSITAYKGSPALLDYSATKGAILAFTRSLSLNLAEKGIRVNAVAPGPIWTPLIPSTFKGDKLKNFGKDTPMERYGEPSEVATCFVFLASDDASYISGQVLHPNGGTIVNG